ncbi:alpha/beta fold hydrolase [Pseudonocardia adelaidensis]|uniref:alpha/beta fold hydrolase n=1 Tax=Pseudonocardia adelaidensis TaxID=648754 RepID=UPI003CD099CA
MRASDGVELAVTEFGGSGPPILLLHGLMGRASTWRAVAGWLVQHGRVVGVDARGHGRSGARGPWTTERMAADVACVLAELGPAVVVGHSMGGLHGLVAAARRPELVRALVVEDMGVDFRGRSAADARAWFGAVPQPFPSLAAVRRAFGHPRAEFGEYMTECVEERPDGYHLLARMEHATAIAADWAERDHWPAVASVRCPALLVEAEESVVPEGQMALMAARMPAATHVRVPGTGHLVHARPEFRPLVQSFLTTHM